MEDCRSGEALAQSKCFAVGPLAAQQQLIHITIAHVPVTVGDYHVSPEAPMFGDAVPSLFKRKSCAFGLGWAAQSVPQRMHIAD
eukprot:6109892-Amphidinium_carterae.1